MWESCVDESGAEVSSDGGLGGTERGTGRRLERRPESYSLASTDQVGLGD